MTLCCGLWGRQRSSDGGPTAGDVNAAPDGGAGAGGSAAAGAPGTSGWFSRESGLGALIDSGGGDSLLANSMLNTTVSIKQHNGELTSAASGRHAESDAMQQQAQAQAQAQALAAAQAQAQADLSRVTALIIEIMSMGLDSRDATAVPTCMATLCAGMGCSYAGLAAYSASGRLSKGCGSASVLDTQKLGLCHPKFQACLDRETCGLAPGPEPSTRSSDCPRQPRRSPSPAAGGAPASISLKLAEVSPAEEQRPSTSSNLNHGKEVRAGRGPLTSLSFPPFPLPHTLSISLSHACAGEPRVGDQHRGDEQLPQPAAGAPEQRRASASRGLGGRLQPPLPALRLAAACP